MADKTPFRRHTPVKASRESFDGETSCAPPPPPPPLLATSSRRLLEWKELPEWQKEDNSFVETGYRQATPSLLQCLCSWQYLHNESVNIFSHLVGAIAFLTFAGLLYSWLKTRRSSASAGDIAVFLVYLLGVAACYTLSVMFHTLMSHSAAGFAFGIQLDFQGIIILMWSATAPLAYYTFVDEPKYRNLYWILTSIFASLASIITFTPAFRQPATKPLRAFVFGSLALSTLLCVVHGLAVHGWEEQSLRFPMRAIGLTLFFNTLGAAVYVMRFPERWWRRKFDVFGASHQLMHCCIVVASLAWLLGVLEAFDNLHADLVIPPQVE